MLSKSFWLTVSLGGNTANSPFREWSRSLLKRHVSQTVEKILVFLTYDPSICEVWLGQENKWKPTYNSSKCLKVINQSNELLNKTIYLATLANKSSLYKIKNV